MKARRHHADDFCFAPVEENALTDDVLRRAEVASPQTVGKNHDVWRVLLVVGGRDSTTVRRRDPEDVEQARTDARDRDSPRLG